MTENASSTAGKAAQHAAALSHCRAPLLEYCAERFSLMLDQANSALLDFAERAESNTVQGRFFEAISHLNHHRGGMKRCFLEYVVQGFEQFGHAPPPPETSLDAAPELSLIAPDEMEESVACENIIIKANANCFPELYALSQRLAIINDGNRINDYEIVGGPYQLVHALRASLRPVEVDVKVKIVLYALFDKVLVRDMLSVYHRMNQTLKEDGILPHIKPVSVKKAREREIRERAAQEERRAAAPETEQGPDCLGNELFDNILDLMSRRHGGSPTGGGKSPLSRAEVASAFDKLPQQRPAATASRGGTEMQVDERFVGRVKQALESEREQVLDALDRDKLSPVDADLIDLIGLLFEYMLNDPVLPNSAKALISHLHTPYLKLALIDRRLLVNSDHPARRLLDEMVEAGSLWMEETHPNRGIYPHIQRVVDRVLQEFSDDVSLFDELLEYFDGAVAEQRKRTDTMERRTTEAARGRERLQLARQRAAKEIQALTHGRTVPPPLLAFLRQTWLDLLAFILLRNDAGEDSEDWSDALDVAQQLTGLFDPKLDEAALESRLQGLPGLRARIRNAVRSLGSHNHAAMERLNTLLDDPREWRERAEREDGSQEVSADNATPASYMRAIVDDSDEADLDDEERAMIERLRKTKFGTWFELKGDDGGPSKRVKLSWMSLLTSTCMFVDRAGMQAEVKTLRELAREMLSGQARVIPKQQHPFIERALVSIRKALSQEEIDAAEGQLRYGAEVGASAATTTQPAPARPTPATPLPSAAPAEAARAEDPPDGTPAADPPTASG
ncbi:MAG: DUF1631 domain-containing protein [Thiohalocapsa sp.]|jgi:hypothetical protein|uniref:DUF1631 domain-containing protein n=1 Tax=Thiohalocapsa sp. TaxID=2497641 RepID=UPI0025FBDAA0|nr:DUF1631 domain-containing protein [Thiohalocapsa sp.]MCG6939844.1 DUF1631 domain-containing protein [Thiohalocapsa sp.]